MKLPLMLLVLVAGAGSLLGQEIKMADGEVVAFTSVKRTEPDGLVILTESGVSKVRFSKMSKEAQQQYGYDPRKAEIYSKQSKQAEIERYQQLVEQVAETKKAPVNSEVNAPVIHSNSTTFLAPKSDSAEAFDLEHAIAEQVTEKMGIVGKKTLAKPQTVPGKSIFIEMPYWPTVRAIWDEVNVDRGNGIGLKEWQAKPNNWEAGLICTCSAIALEFYGSKMTPREILQNSVGLTYDQKLAFTDFYADRWYDSIVSTLQTKGYSWIFKSLRRDSTQFQKDLQSLKDSLDMGNPGIVSVSIPPVDQYAKWHAVVVQGYDETKQVIYVLDPSISRPGYRVISYKNFESIWHTLDGTDMRYIMLTSFKK